MSRQKSTTEKPAGRQPKKIETKSPVEKVAEKSARKSTVTAEIQYSGKAIPISEIYARAREVCGNDSDIKIYIKPEENRVYYVYGDSAGSSM